MVKKRKQSGGYNLNKKKQTGGYNLNKKKQVGSGVFIRSTQSGGLLLPVGLDPSSNPNPIAREYSLRKARLLQ
jgi:hypothetical protein